MTSVGYITVKEFPEASGSFYNISSTLLEDGTSVLRIRLRRNKLEEKEFRRYLNEECYA